jgi:hypothetical protein
MSETETGSELLRRVNEAMSGTIQEQLKELVVAARSGIEQFSDAAAQQGTLLADAHAGIVDAHDRLGRALDDARMQLSEDLRLGMEELARAREADRETLQGIVDELERKVASMDASVTDAMDVLRSDVEAMHNAADVRAQEAFSVFTGKMEWQMTTIESEFQRRAQDMHEDFSERAAGFERAIAATAEQGENTRSTIMSRIEFIERAMKDIRDQMEQTSADNMMRFEQIMKKLEDTSGIEERAAHHLVALLGHALGAIDPCETDVENAAEPDPMSA